MKEGKIIGRRGLEVQGRGGNRRKSPKHRVPAKPKIGGEREVILSWCGPRLVNV